MVMHPAKPEFLYNDPSATDIESRKSETQRCAPHMKPK